MTDSRYTALQYGQRQGMLLASTEAKGLNESREKRNLAVYLGVYLILNELVGLRRLRLSVSRVMLVFQLLSKGVALPFQSCYVDSITVLWTGIVSPSRTLSVLSVVLNVSTMPVQILR